MSFHHGCSYRLKHLTLRILTGKQQTSHSKSLGPSKETYKEATKTKQVHLASKWRKYGTLTSMGEKNHIAHFNNKATMKNTTSD